MEQYQLTNKVMLDIDEEPYIMMMKYAHMFSPNECSGTGLAEKEVDTDGTVRFKVVEVFLPNQKNSPCRTDIAAGEANRINTQLVMDGKCPSKHIFHWHSHVDMAVYESGTDEENYDEMQTGKFSLSLVVNKRYELYGSFHLYDPLRIDVSNIEVEVPEIDLASYDVPAELQTIIMNNVDTVQAWEAQQKEETKKEWANSYPKGGYTQPNYYDYYDVGLDWDECLYEILNQAEKAGLLTLKYNCKDGYIIGYTNKEGESFDLTSNMSQDWGKDTRQYEFYND